MVPKVLKDLPAGRGRMGRGLENLDLHLRDRVSDDVCWGQDAAIF